MDKLTEKTILDLLSNKEKEEQKKEEKPQEKLNILGIIMTLMLIIILALIIGMLYQHREPLYAGNVHWRVELNMQICGEKIEICNECGIKPFYYKDGILHITGPIKKKEEIQLMNFFESINMTIEENKINDYLDCQGKLAKTKITVNNLPINYKNYTIEPTTDAKKQKILVNFDTITG